MTMIEEGMMQTIYDIKAGDSECVSKKFTQADVILFSCMTGDFDPVYLDDYFAEKRHYRKQLVHGLMVAGLVNTAIKTLMPGPGSRLIHQDLEFFEPVYVDDTVTVTVTVNRCDILKNHVTLFVEYMKQDNTLVIQGQCLVSLAGPPMSRITRYEGVRAHV